MRYSQILLLTIIVPFYSTDYISTITNGTIGYNITVNISVFSEEFRGMLLYCVDSSKNKLKIKLSKEKDNDTNIRIKYNDAYTDNKLKDICGCDLTPDEPCQLRWFNFTFKLGAGRVNTSCNNFKQPASVSGQNINKNKTALVLAVPKTMVDTKNRTYCIVGNLGPFDDEKNLRSFPIKVQMFGCVETLKFNNSNIDFKASSYHYVGNKVKWKCVRQCISKDICNGGSCIETFTHLRCQCNHTVLNGPYCNHSLKMYTAEGNHSYITYRPESFMYWKMSWNMTSITTKDRCLLEFESNGVYHLIYNDGQLSSLSGGNRINFVNVIVANNRIIYNISNKIFNYSFTMSDNTRVNVGFSERDINCTILEGSYDIIYDRSLFKKYIFPITTTVSPNDTDDSNGTSTTTPRDFAMMINNSALKNNNIIFVIVSSLIVIIVIIAISISVILKLRLKVGVKPIPEVIDIDDDDYSSSNNPDYEDCKVLNYDGAYSTGPYTYGSYKQSTSYSYGYNGPQLPPRDEDKKEWIDIREDFKSEISDAQYMPYNSVDYKRTYICIEDGEYARVRQSVLSSEEPTPQLPPRDE